MPKITIRLDDKAYELLQERSSPSERGRSGGPAHTARCIIHEALGLPAPELYAKEPSPRKNRRIGERGRPRAARDGGAGPSPAT